MSTNRFTALEFLEMAEKKGYQLFTIKKEVPVGSGRWLLFGFEFSKRSSKYKQKYMLANPIPLDDLKKGPIRKPIAEPTADAATGDIPAPPAVQRSERTAVGGGSVEQSGHARNISFASRIRSFVGAIFS